MIFDNCKSDFVDCPLCEMELSRIEFKLYSALCCENCVSIKNFRNMFLEFKDNKITSLSITVKNIYLFVSYISDFCNIGFVDKNDDLEGSLIFIDFVPDFDYYDLDGLVKK